MQLGRVVSGSNNKLSIELERFASEHYGKCTECGYEFKELELSYWGFSSAEYLLLFRLISYALVVAPVKIKGFVSLLCERTSHIANAFAGLQPPCVFVICCFDPRGLILIW